MWLMKIKESQQCQVFASYAIDNYANEKKINNDQEPIQSDPTSCPQNQKGNN